MHLFINSLDEKYTKQTPTYYFKDTCPQHISQIPVKKKAIQNWILNQFNSIQGLAKTRKKTKQELATWMSAKSGIVFSSR